jgi:hypothetical protein
MNIKRKNLYTPTALLKVSGFQQFKQEWIGVKGIKSYRKVLSYIKTLAEKRKAPVEHFIGLGR